MMNEILNSIKINNYQLSVFGYDVYSEPILDDLVGVIKNEFDAEVIDCFNITHDEVLTLMPDSGNIILTNFGHFRSSYDVNGSLTRLTECRDLIGKIRNRNVHSFIFSHTYTDPVKRQPVISGGNSVIFMSDFVGIMSRKGEHPYYTFNLRVMKDRFGNDGVNMDITTIAKSYIRERKLEQLLDKKPLKLDNGLSQKENKKGRIWQIFQNS